VSFLWKPTSAFARRRHRFLAAGPAETDRGPLQANRGLRSRNLQELAAGDYCIGASRKVCRSVGLNTDAVRASEFSVLALRAFQAVLQLDLLGPLPAHDLVYVYLRA